MDVDFKGPFIRHQRKVDKRRKALKMGKCLFFISVSNFFYCYQPWGFLTLLRVPLPH